MTLWNPPSVTKEMDNKQVANLVAELIDDVAFIMNGNIDWKNIRAQSIQTENLAAGSITADKIAANAVTASKIDVDELSAISADLGHITAGSVDAITITGSVITGSLIQTVDFGNFPRAGLNNAANMFFAEASATKYILIRASFSNNLPYLSFYNGSLETQLRQDDQTFVIGGSSQIQIFPEDRLLLTPLNDLELSPLTGDVTVPNWGRLYNRSTGRSLQQDLNSLDARITALGG